VSPKLIGLVVQINRDLKEMAEAAKIGGLKRIEV